MDNPLFSKIADALPDHFPFYDLGEVESAGHRLPEEISPQNSFEDCYAVAFRFYGDVSATLLVVFDKGLDVSVYSELGNILASHAATELARDHDDAQLMISPPRVLGEKQMARLLKERGPFLQRAYLHFCRDAPGGAGKEIPVRVIVLPTPDGGGHA